MCAIELHNAADVFNQLAALRDVADSTAVRAVIENHDACFNAEAAAHLAAFQAHFADRLIADHARRLAILHQRAQLNPLVVLLPSTLAIAG